MSKIQLLPIEKQELEEELYDLFKAYDELIKKRKEAASEGDLSENASYEAVVTEIASVENEIKKIEEIINNSELINVSKIDKSRVGIGTVVVIREVETGDDYRLTFVGDNRGDSTQKKMSRMSEIGGTIYGKEVGQEVTVLPTNGKSTVYRIMSIE